MIDYTTAERLRLHYLHARGSEFGKYLTPGNIVTPYYGLVCGPVSFTFDSQITITIPFIKVVSHGEPLLLLGADGLRGGRPLSQWNFVSVGARTLAVGKVEGFLEFVRNGVSRQVTLINAPSGSGDRAGTRGPRP